jgi:thiosulfate dehydrogenase
VRTALIAASAVVLWGCPPQQRPVAAVDFGASLFADPRLSESAFNTVSCSTCHATSEAPPEGRLDSGPTLYNSAFRGTWWGGYEVRLLDAVNFCFLSFMRGDVPLTAEDPKSRALYEYLVSLSPEEIDPLPFTVIKDVADVPPGDAARGAEVYRAACQVCHGEPHTGDGRGSPLASVLPEVSADYATVFPGVSPRLVVIEKIRHGQFFGVGGTMPPYSREALSDADVAALLAFFGL